MAIVGSELSRSIYNKEKKSSSGDLQVNAARNVARSRETIIITVSAPRCDEDDGKTVKCRKL